MKQSSVGQIWITATASVQSECVTPDAALAVEPSQSAVSWALETPVVLGTFSRWIGVFITNVIMNSNGPMSMALVAFALITVRSVGRNVFTCFCVVCLAIVILWCCAHIQISVAHKDFLYFGLMFSIFTPPFYHFSSKFKRSNGVVWLHSTVAVCKYSHAPNKGKEVLQLWCKFGPVAVTGNQPPNVSIFLVFNEQD